MKTCPYCAEEIQDQAIKCRHCGSPLDRAPITPAFIFALLFGLAALGAVIYFAITLQ